MWASANVFCSELVQKGPEQAGPTTDNISLTFLLLAMAVLLIQPSVWDTLLPARNMVCSCWYDVYLFCRVAQDFSCNSEACHFFKSCFVVITSCQTHKTDNNVPIDRFQRNLPLFDIPLWLLSCSSQFILLWFPQLINIIQHNVVSNSVDFTDTELRFGTVVAVNHWKHVLYYVRL